MFKKSLALVLAFVLCLGILAGCEQKPVETTKPTDAPKPTETQKPTETTAPTTEPVPTEYQFPAGAKLDVWSTPNVENTAFDKFVEKVTGLDVDFIVYENEKLQAALTEKVTPSLVFRTDVVQFTKLGRYGAFVNLYDYQDLLPNFFAIYNSDEMADFRETYEIYEGELYCAPVWLNGDAQLYGWMYREDIFEELSLEVPTDWDSFLACLRALKAAYPESYPLTMRNWTGNINALIELAQQFGTLYERDWPNCPFVLDKETNTWYESVATDEFRNMLQMLRGLIDEGLMDIAVLNYDTALWSESMASGRAFITFDKAFQLGNLESAGKQVNEKFSLGYFNSIPLVESDIPYTTRTPAVTTHSWGVTSKCPDLELALRYLDWLYTEEGKNTVCWGVENESYGIDADGAKYFLESFPESERAMMAKYALAGDMDFLATMSTYSKKTQEMMLSTTAAAAEGGLVMDPSIIYNEAETTIQATYHTGYMDTRSAGIQKFLLGKLDINSDADWAQFLANLEANGQKELLQIANDAWARNIAE